MRKLLLIAGVAALAIPSIASAQPGCMERQHDNRIAGTVVGAGLGAVLGSAIAGPGSRGAGAVVGAVGGGAIGNAAGGSSVSCGGYTQVGYYDADGVWQAGPGYYDADGVWRQASGYYDQDGDWVDAAPPPPPQPAPSPPYAGDYGADVAYAGAPDDMNARETWIEHRIHEGDASGAISRGDAEHDFDVLAGIREFQAHHADEDGGLSASDRADVMNKLDNLSAIVHSQWHD
jgi:hypothetical protein